MEKHRLTDAQKDVLYEMGRGSALVQTDLPLTNGRIQTVYSFEGGDRVKPQIVQILEREGLIYQNEEDGRVIYRPFLNKVSEVVDVQRE